MCGEAGWVAGAEGGVAAGKEAAAVGREAVEAVALVGKEVVEAAALCGDGNAAAGADEGQRVSASSGEGRRAVKEACPDKCLLLEGPASRISTFRKIQLVSADILIAQREIKPLYC